MDGYSTFLSPSPYVIMPDTTAAVWWVRDANGNDWGQPDYAQILYIQQLDYRKDKPPGYPAPKQ